MLRASYLEHHENHTVQQGKEDKVRLVHTVLFQGLISQAAEEDHIITE